MPAEIDPAALRATANGPVVGMVPVVDTIAGRRIVHLVPYTEGARQGATVAQHDWALPAEVEDDITKQVIDTLPPEVRVSDRERFATLSKQLLADGAQSYATHGYIQWPASVEADLKAMGWKRGQTDLHAQVEALATRYIIEAANRQKEQDLKKVTLDHGGHYSA